MDYSPWFYSILGHFHTFSINFNYFCGCKKHAFLAILDQKAWTIAHGFDRFWVIYTPFQLISIIFFDRFWVIFTPFKLFLMIQKTCIFGHS
jgi:hypothetical protein